MVTTLKNTDGTWTIVDEGESHDLIARLYNTQGNPLDAATVDTLVLTLMDEVTGTIINSRDEQDVQGANGGSISNGILTVRLNANDNILVGTSDEYHIAILKFTWTDVSTRTGIHSVRFKIRAADRTIYYSNQNDIEEVYGAENIRRWADSENTRDEGLIEIRIEWANLMAKTWIDARLNRGHYSIPFVAPYPTLITLISASLAGLMLYDTRRVADSDADDRVPQQRKNAEMLLQQIQSGQIKLLDRAGNELTLATEISPKVKEFESKIVTRDDLSYPFTLVEN